MAAEFEPAQGAFVPAGFLVALGGQRGQRVPVLGGELDVLFGHESISLKNIEISNYLIYRVFSEKRDNFNSFSLQNSPFLSCGYLYPHLEVRPTYWGVLKWIISGA